MGFEVILGQENAVKQLRKALQSDRLAHAYLFHGPRGTGKKLTALEFAKTLYCPAAPSGACDACATCRKIANRNHPDVLLMETEGAAVRIEAIRMIQNRLSYKPYESERTTIIIDGCELLTLPASNALLKTLEEPPGNGLLLLLASRKEALPLTIVSRCRLLSFRPLDPQDIAAILCRRGVNTETARSAAMLAEGSLESFAEADPAHLLTRRQAAYDLLSSALAAGNPGLFAKARQLAGKRDQCEELLRWLELLCRDMVILKAAPAIPLHNQDLGPGLTELATPLTQERLLDTCDLIRQLRHHIAMNVNPQLIFERLLIHLQQTLGATAAARSV